jgi:hypothetical protein
MGSELAQREARAPLERLALQVCPSPDLTIPL